MVRIFVYILNMIVEIMKIENNCTECLHFISYANYYYDENELEDQGFCREGQNDGYGDSVYTCNLFKGKIK